MILHPAFKTLVSQPELLAEHAGAYAELAVAEASELSNGLRMKGVLMAGAAACGALGAGLAGVAALFVAAVPLADMPAPWALAVVPAVPLAIAAGLWWAQDKRPVDMSFKVLRSQLALDRSLWNRIGQE